MMMWLVIIIVTLAIIGTVTLVIYQSAIIFRRYRQTKTQINMEAAWRLFMIEDGMAHMLFDNALIELKNRITGEVRESVHQSLQALEKRLATDTHPMLTIRKELMDSIDRRQLNAEILNLPVNTRSELRKSHPDILQTDDNARTYIDANELRIAVLRAYAGLRYGDRVDGDWFDVYQKASSLRQRGTRGYIERAVGGTTHSTDDIRFQTMTLMDNEIRERLLQVPAGTRFPGFGKSA
jgi:hypothetical protein